MNTPLRFSSLALAMLFAWGNAGMCASAFAAGATSNTANTTNAATTAPNSAAANDAAANAAAAADVSAAAEDISSVVTDADDDDDASGVTPTSPNAAPTSPAAATAAASASATAAQKPAGAKTAQQQKLQPVPDGAPLPPSNEDQIEPQVTIKQSGENKVEEYRINGKLYMVKVTPLHGPPYYLYDDDGTGNLIQHAGPGNPTSPPQWVLYKW